jgi:flavin reductase (DIM6/NTAB) family NADH-FMN oxidoreductase RutF
MLSTIDIPDIADSQVIEPAILYFGTPVVLIGSTNEDGSPNLAPMSSAWWVGWRCMLGLASNSKSTENLIRTGECVLNLPSADLVDAVNKSCADHRLESGARRQDQARLPARKEQV